MRDLVQQGLALRELLRQRILVLDGAMGTMLQQQNLTAADFGGPKLEGCNENLVLTRPDVVLAIHRKYLEAGSDIIDTDWSPRRERSAGVRRNSRGKRPMNSLRRPSLDSWPVRWARRRKHSAFRAERRSISFVKAFTSRGAGWWKAAWTRCCSKHASIP